MWLSWTSHNPSALGVVCPVAAPAAINGGSSSHRWGDTARGELPCELAELLLAANLQVNVASGVAGWLVAARRCTICFSVWQDRPTRRDSLAQEALSRWTTLSDALLHHIS